MKALACLGEGRFLGGYHKICSKKDFEEYKKVALDLTKEMFYA